MVSLVLTSAQLGRLRAAGHASGATPVVFLGEAYTLEAFVVVRRRGGLLLCLPADGLPKAERERAADGRFSGCLGPSVEVIIESPSAGGTPGKMSTESRWQTSS